MKFLFALLLLPALAFGQAFTMNDIPFMSQGSGWAQRVVANGGAMPSANTINCMETLRLRLIAMSLTNGIYTLCIYVPDSLIAATTPLIKHAGSDPWANVNFASSNLSIKGLEIANPQGLKYLDTGVPNSTMSRFSFGISCIISESFTNIAAGGIIAGEQNLTDTRIRQLQHSGNSTASAAQIYTSNTGGASTIVTTNDTSRTGFISGNLYTNGGSNVVIYVGNTLESFKTLAVKPLVSGENSGVVSANTIPFFTGLLQGTNQANGFIGTMSMGALHIGWDSTQASNFMWAVTSCRECLGGGTGDPVEDYNRRVVRAGGSTVSANTSNTFRAAYQRIDTNSLLYDMIAANFYATDSLVAASTPLIWKGGHSTWTNGGGFFSDTNLSINGLKGNLTSKFLGTGLQPANLNIGGISDTSAGISQMTFDAGTAANTVEEGTLLTATFWFIQRFSGSLSYYCWAVTTLNTTFVQIAAPGGDAFAGYVSGNRTAANAIRLDWVTNQVHNVATNGTGANASNNNNLTNMFAHAASSGSTPANWSDKTVSFLSFHGGLTQTKSSNLWAIAALVRTNYGGGVPP